jgi:hypothetical protein
MEIKYKEDSSCLREISEYVSKPKEVMIKDNSLLQKVSTVEDSSVEHANYILMIFKSICIS